MSTQVETKKSFVELQEYHQPTLADGDYTITIAQTVGFDKQPDIAEFTAARDFTVAGERFALNPTVVEAVFPPDGNFGDHSNVLPHVTLNRSTLPWERTVNGEQGNAVPWLALLLFDENEKPKPETMTLDELIAQAKKGSPKFPVIEKEISQQYQDVLTVIDVPKALLQAIMPTAEELTMLTHVRFATIEEDKPAAEESADEPAEGEFAVILTNRLPQQGRTSIAHLVSVEGRFKKVGDAYEFDYPDKDTDLVRLVSLKSWSFACASKHKSFKELLTRLNSTPSTLRLPDVSAAAQKFFTKGYVLVPHSFREGDKTASWFRGPFLPGKNKSPRMTLPARSADELVRYDPALSMFDVSYAAAWELGRLLALQDKDFSVSLYQWKRRRAQKLAQRKQRAEKPLLHLPFQRETSAEIPPDIASWFERLRKLEGVPFNYLVPDERMLPEESIRFFQLDQSWVDCLADGAFSIGRVAGSDLRVDGAHDLQSPANADDGVRTGFFLRSEVVSGWPGLLVEGFSDQPDKPAPKIVRMERLAAGVLLCIFAGEVARVEIYEKPEMLHFGFTVDEGGVHKKLRDSKGKIQPSMQIDLKDEHWRQQSRTQPLNIVEVAKLIKGTPPLPPLTSAQFGLQMVESGDKVIFLTNKS